MTRPYANSRLSQLAAAFLILCLLFTLSWVPVLAAEQSPDSPAAVARPVPAFQEPASQMSVPRLMQQGEPLDLPAAALDITWKLVLVLVLAYGLLAILRRYSLGLPFVQRHATLQVLESVPLGPNRGLYVVRAGSTRLLVGATPSQISALGQWEGDALQPSAESLTIPLSDVLPPSIPHAD